MAFNCDFNAPMFVDFDNLDGEENADEFFGKLFQKNVFQIREWIWTFSPDTHNEDGPLNLEQDAPELDVPPRVTRTSSQSTSSQPLKRKKPSKWFMAYRSHFNLFSSLKPDHSKF